MKKNLVLFILVISCKTETVTSDFDFTTAFESSNGTQTPEYSEVISYYEQFAELKAKNEAKKVSNKRLSSSWLPN